MDYRDNSKAARRRRRKRQKFLQAVIPVAVALILIAVVIVVGLKNGLFDSFFYSSSKADLKGYFLMTSESKASRIVDGEVTDDKVDVKDGVCYLPLDKIKSEYDNRYYYDEKGNALLYTTGEGTQTAVIGDNYYTLNGAGVQTGYTICYKDNDTLNVALDYVKMHVNLEYNLFGGSGEPYRVEIKTDWGTDILANVVADESAVRVSADKKADILKTVKKGAVLKILSSETEEWMKVETDDLISGYIEKKHLGEKYEEDETPVVDAKEVVVPSLASNAPVVLAWHNVTGENSAQNLADYSSRLNDMNVISPTWFYLDSNDGEIRSIGDPEYVAAAHAAGVKVWGLVENMSNAEVSTNAVLTDTAKRSYVISQLLTYATALGLDGINVDFESVSEETGEAFIQFIRELVVEAHKNNLVVSVDNYVPRETTAHYNRREQGVFADYVIIMGYDEHYSGSEEAGSVASLPFVMDGINQTLNEVPANKVINAVPFYTRLWFEKPSSEGIDLSVQTIPMDQGPKSVSAAGATAEWNEEAGQYYAEWDNDGGTSKIWLEDGESIKAKMDVMRASNLAGVAIWQLAFSTDEAWDAIKEAYPVVK